MNQTTNQIEAAGAMPPPPAIEENPGDEKDVEKLADGEGLDDASKQVIANVLAKAGYKTDNEQTWDTLKDLADKGLSIASLIAMPPKKVIDFLRMFTGVLVQKQAVKMYEGRHDTQTTENLPVAEGVEMTDDQKQAVVDSFNLLARRYPGAMGGLNITDIDSPWSSSGINEETGMREVKINVKATADKVVLDDINAHELGNLMRQSLGDLHDKSFAKSNDREPEGTEKWSNKLQDILNRMRTAEQNGGQALKMLTQSTYTQENSVGYQPNAMNSGEELFAQAFCVFNNYQDQVKQRFMKLSVADVELVNELMSCLPQIHQKQ